MAVAENIVDYKKVNYFPLDGYFIKSLCKVVRGLSPREQAAVTRHLWGQAAAGESQASARDCGPGHKGQGLIFFENVEEKGRYL